MWGGHHVRGVGSGELRDWLLRGEGHRVRGVDLNSHYLKSFPQKRGSYNQ